ncbi:hypothetical protein [Peterkaempfera bronchialis]|uniref:hypothetical protein n=1 Tax=Peterkaempfera bronchialis TaxID=2126346 RepID=UPI003C2F3531
MDSTPHSSLSPHALGPQLLERLTAPLRQAGWVQDETWYEGDEEDEEPGTGPTCLVFSRSNFHIAVTWHPTGARLTVEDQTDGWDWHESLPPLCPLDEPLGLDLSGHVTHAAKAEAARRAFAEADLLDAPPASTSRRTPRHYTTTWSCCCGRTPSTTRSTATGATTGIRRSRTWERTSPGEWVPECAPTR